MLYVMSALDPESESVAVTEATSSPIRMFSNTSTVRVVLGNDGELSLSSRTLMLNTQVDERGTIPESSAIILRE